MIRLDFVFFDAGGGHRAAAIALGEAIEREKRPLEVRLMNLQELLDEIDVFRKLTGVRLQDLYNLMLKKGWTLGSAKLTAWMHGVIRLFHGRQVRLLEEYWRRSRPDMVVSLIPNFNRALCQSLRQALPGTPLVTVLTDIADYPPHFWIEPFAGGLQEQYFICGSAKAAEQAREMGHAADKVLRASGMILSPRFYDAARLAGEERARARRALGLDPECAVGLVLFGGQGSAAMVEIAARLADRQLILICGHNTRLRDKLRAMSHRAPIFVEGFTQEIPHYMQLADYFIGKPGPGSISEAVAMRLPVIVERNAWTLPQERYNADWVREQGVGVVLKNFRGIGEAVARMLEPAAYARYRAATERQNNRAVFEIPEMLERIGKAAGK
ncbi:MAG: glycosyltransferase [Bryobacteraceae bacterium]|jgi:1,2-diacylglycerol 3-beta-galactosyltransferase